MVACPGRMNWFMNSHVTNEIQTHFWNDVWRFELWMLHWWFSKNPSWWKSWKCDFGKSLTFNVDINNFLFAHNLRLINFDVAGNAHEMTNSRHITTSLLSRTLHASQPVSQQIRTSLVSTCPPSRQQENWHTWVTKWPKPRNVQKCEYE